MLVTEIIAYLESRGRRPAHLRPETAQLLASYLRQYVDSYAEPVLDQIYRLDAAADEKSTLDDALCETRNLLIAYAAFDSAVKQYPDKYIVLRNGIRVIKQTHEQVRYCPPFLERS